MFKQRTVSLAIATLIAVFGFCFTANTYTLPKEDKGTGKLKATSNELKVIKPGTPTILTENVMLNNLQVTSPKCSAMPPAPGKPIREFTRSNIQKASQIGILFSPMKKVVELHKFAMQIRRGNKVLFTTKLECDGCMKTYKPVDDPKAIAGYLFVLDQEAAAAADKYFAAGNTVWLLVSGHNGGPARFYFINAQDPQLLDAGAKSKQ